MALTQLTDLQPTNIKVTGIATFDQTVGIAGTLTYEDVTNIDSVGIGTFRDGINVIGHAELDNVNVSGISTFSGDVTLNGDELFIADSIKHVGDTDTSISFPANDTIRFSTAGSERIRIADGKVGIGTQSPNELLHVSGNSSGAITAKIENTFSSDATRFAILELKSGVGSIRFHDQGDTIEGEIKYDSTTNSMRFHTNGNTERLRIDNSGRIGLGIANPGDYFSSYNRVVMGRTNDTGGMTIVSAPTSGGYIAFADGTSGNEAYRGQIAYYHSQDSMMFGTDGGTERLRINNKGHLGLNVTPGSWDNTFKALEGGGSSKHGELFFQANGDWTTALGCNLYFNSGWKYRHAGAANWLEMKEDRTTFYMADSGSADSAISWLERLRIHSTGYITKPYQVAFFAHCTFGNHDLSAGDKFQFNVLTSSGKAAVDSTHHTFGGTAVFNTSNNTFTAPVAGLYSFTVTAYYRRTGDPLSTIVPRVNNTEVNNGNNTIFFFGSNDITDGNTLSGTVYLQLAANDAVTVHRRTNQSGTCRFYGPHSHFCGHLIG